MSPIDVLLNFAIVIVASIVASIVFPFILFTLMRKSLTSWIANIVSVDTKQKMSNWIQSAVKNGISDALKDSDIKKAVIELIELSEKIINKKLREEKK